MADSPCQPVDALTSALAIVAQHGGGGGKTGIARGSQLEVHADDGSSAFSLAPEAFPHPARTGSEDSREAATPAAAGAAGSGSSSLASLVLQISGGSGSAAQRVALVELQANDAAGMPGWADACCSAGVLEVSPPLLHS